MPGTPFFGSEHSWIVSQRFDSADYDLLKIRMLRIQQPIFLSLDKYRGDNQQAALGLLYECIADACQFWRGRAFAPVRGKIVCFDTLARQLIWNLHCGQN